MGTRHRRRRSTLAVVAIVTVIVGIRLTGAGAVQPAAAPAPVSSSPAPAPTPSSTTTTPSSTTTGPTTHPTATAGKVRQRPTTVHSSEPSAGPQPSVSPQSSPGTQPSAGAPVSPSADPTPTVPVCAAGSIRVGSLTAVGDASSVLAAGSAVRFTLEATSSASAACIFVPALDLVITSGHDRIWTSADCPVAAVGGPGVTAAPTLTGTAQTLLIPGGTVLGPGSTVSFDLVWPGVRSVGSCTAAAGTLTAGTYVASVTVADAGSTGTAFGLN